MGPEFGAERHRSETRQVEVAGWNPAGPASATCDRRVGPTCGDMARSSSSKTPPVSVLIQISHPSGFAGERAGHACPGPPGGNAANVLEGFPVSPTLSWTCYLHRDSSQPRLRGPEPQAACDAITRGHPGVRQRTRIRPKRSTYTSGPRCIGRGFGPLSPPNAVASCGRSSVGRASRCQREGRGFEPRWPLHIP